MFKHWKGFVFETKFILSVIFQLNHFFKNVHMTAVLERLSTDFSTCLMKLFGNMKYSIRFNFLSELRLPSMMNFSKMYIKVGQNDITMKVLIQTRYRRDDLGFPFIEKRFVF